MLTRLKLMLSSLWSFLQPFIQIFLSEIGPVLAASAIRAVSAVERDLSGQPGAEKRGEAFSRVLSDLRNQGVLIGFEVTVSMINAAIEAAVQKLKADRAEVRVGG